MVADEGLELEDRSGDICEYIGFIALNMGDQTSCDVQADEQEYVCSFVWFSDKYILLAHMVPTMENGALSVIKLSGKPLNTSLSTI